MTPDPNAHANPTTYGLGRWLVGGLVAGGVVLGLLVGAYHVGYDRGSHGTAPAPAATTTATPATTGPSAGGASAAAIGAVEPTPALVARGKQLFSSDSCVGCHSLGTTAGAGPGIGGLAGRSVQLVGGKSVTADDAYLVRAIVDPDAEIVDGYKPGMMSAAIASLHLGTKPDDVRALVAFIKAQK